MQDPVGRCLGVRIFNIINASFYLLDALESPTSKTSVIFKALFSLHSVSILETSLQHGLFDAIQILRLHSTLNSNSLVRYEYTIYT